MGHDLNTALDHCLTLLRNGEDIENCLARYPEYGRQLRPLLDMAVQVGQVVSPVASESARTAGEQRMLAALAQKQERGAGTNPALHTVGQFIRSLGHARGWGLRPAWTVAGVVLMVLLLVGGAATAAASVYSLPGDALYPVKQVGRRVQLSLTFDAYERRQLEERFQAQQRGDIQRALERGQQSSVEFEGTVQSMEGVHWMVGDLPVTIDAQTMVVGQPVVGIAVHVHGVLPGDGSIHAVEVRTDPALLPEPTHTATPTASPAPTMTAAPTETPLPTATPQPTRTPVPTETDRPSETPEPTKAPDLSSTPEPSETPEPTSAPTGVDTQEPDSEPRPTRTPEPTEAQENPTAAPTATQTVRPAATPRPTETPLPTATPQPTSTPHPTATSHPTQTPHPSDTPHSTDTPYPTNTPQPTRTEEPDDD